MALVDNLVAYYKLDEASGNAADATGGGLTLTNNGSMPYGTGIINNGAQTSSGSYLNRNTVLSAATANVSVSLWVNISGTSLSGAFFHNGTGPNNGWGIGVGNVQYDGAGGTGNNLILLIDAVAWRVPGSLGGTGWKHVVVTRGATTWTSYVNGSALGSTFTDTPLTPASNTDVGRDVGQTAPFTGTIDEIGYWSRELSAAEVTELYNSGAGLSYPFASASGANLRMMMGIGS